MSGYIDAHCHLADSRFDCNLGEVLDRSTRAGVTAWVQGGVSPEDWENQLRVQARFGKSIIPAFGLHPWWVSANTRDQVDLGLSHLERQIPLAMALGELGLDLSPKGGGREGLEHQTYAFERQLDLGKREIKPLVLHIVQAHAEAISILKRKGPFPAGGLVHSFSGSLPVAQEYLSLGFLISVGGTVMQKGRKQLKEAVASIPSDRLVLETDSPDQLPSPLVGKRMWNEPEVLLQVAQVAAEIRGEVPSELLLQSARNLRILLQIGI